MPSLQPRFKEVMHKVSAQWAALIEMWNTLCVTMDREAPEWRTGTRARCRDTYDMMHAAIYENAAK